MNPFLLAALVFGAIGLIQEGLDAKEKAEKPALPKPKEPKPAAVAGPQTIVNVGGDKKPEPAKKEPKKPAKEPKPSDG